MILRQAKVFLSLAAVAILFMGIASQLDNREVKLGAGQTTVATGLPVSAKQDVLHDKKIEEKLAQELRIRQAQEAAARATRNRPKPQVPVVTAPQVQYDAGSIQDTICKAFGAACQKALRVARCESGFRPNATNGQFRGLFQIGVRIHAELIRAKGFTIDQMWEVGPNITMALQLSRGGTNWRAWECQ